MTKCETMNEKSLDTDLTKLMDEYLKTLSEKEMHAYEIAKSFLGMSFQLEKSNAFLQWKKQKVV